MRPFLVLSLWLCIGLGITAVIANSMQAMYVTVHDGDGWQPQQQAGRQFPASRQEQGRVVPAGMTTDSGRVR